MEEKENQNRQDNLNAQIEPEVKVKSELQSDDWLDRHAIKKSQQIKTGLNLKIKVNFNL